MSRKTEEERKNFVEEVGIVFEQTGMPRMAGRVFGWLLIAEPSHQNTEQIAGGLLASRGSISTTTRLLIQHGFVERLSLPGVRHDYFRLREDAWEHLMERGIEDEIKMFLRLSERGLEMVPEGNSSSRKWLEEMRDLYAFLQAEIPAVRERWQKQRKKSR